MNNFNIRLKASLTYYQVNIYVLNQEVINSIHYGFTLSYVFNNALDAHMHTTTLFGCTEFVVVVHMYIQYIRMCTLHVQYTTCIMYMIQYTTCICSYMIRGTSIVLQLMKYHLFIYIRTIAIDSRCRNIYLPFSKTVARQSNICRILQKFSRDFISISRTFSKSKQFF